MNTALTTERYEREYTEDDGDVAVEEHYRNKADRS